MGRRSSGGFRSAPRPRPRPVAAPARSSAPQTVKNATPPATAQASNGGGSVLGNIGSTIVEGIGFGTGSSIGHRAVDFGMGPRTFRTETVVTGANSVTSPVANAAVSSSCGIHNSAFLDCVNKFGSDIPSERSSSRPRTSSASRSSRSSQSSARSAPSPRPAAASSPSIFTGSSTSHSSSYSSPPKTEKSTPRTSSYSESPKQTVDHDYSSSGSSSDEGKSTPRTATYTPPPHDDDYYHDSYTYRRSRDVVYGIVDGILDAIYPSRAASKSKADPVPAPSVPEVTNGIGSIACVTQAKTFQDCLNKFETNISECQTYMDLWCRCKRNYKESSDSTLTA